MANKKNFAGILVIALIFVITLFGCAGDTSNSSVIDPALNGTWDGDYTEFILNNGNFELSLLGKSPAEKGTYTTSDNNMTITTTHIFGRWQSGDLEAKWYTKAELLASPLGPNLTDYYLDTWFGTKKGTYYVSGTEGTQLAIRISGWKWDINFNKR